MSTLDSFQRQAEAVEKKIFSLCIKDLSSESSLFKSIQHQLGLGGSRTRSLHALQISQLLNCNETDSVALASACELLHQASLVHDDLQDEHLTRRGMPSVWNKFGKNCALCLGDLLLSAAYAALADCENRLRLNALLATTHAYVSNVISGQCEDIEGRTELLTLDKYEQIVQKKSGALLALPLELAITYCGAPAEYALLRCFFQNYSLTYQVLDDIEDYHEDWLVSSALKSPNLLAMMKVKYHTLEAATIAAHRYINNLFVLMEMTCKQLTPKWRTLFHAYSHALYHRFMPNISKKNRYALASLHW